MGQSVTVKANQSSNPEVLRFEINRSLTGMGHERYYSHDDIIENRAVDVLAGRLLDQGGIQQVHIHSSVITVHLAGGSTGEGLLDVIENLFRFYPDGAPEPMLPGEGDEEAPAEDAAAATDA